MRQNELNTSFSINNQGLSNQDGILQSNLSPVIYLIMQDKNFSFGEFRDYHNLCNFCLLFNKKGFNYKLLIEQEFIKRFINENQELNLILCELITDLEGTIEDEKNKEICELLYEAYKIIINYNGVTNYLLFR